MTAEFIFAMIMALLAVGGLVFNTGVLYNDISHLRKSVDKIWEKLDEIEKYLRDSKE